MQVSVSDYPRFLSSKVSIALHFLYSSYSARTRCWFILRSGFIVSNLWKKNWWTLAY